MTRFDRAVKRYGLSSPELIAWVRRNKERSYVPEDVLSQLNLTTIYHTKEPQPYPLAEGTVIPEPTPVPTEQEVEQL